MADTFNLSHNYQIEVSGWGLDEVFFVEKTDLLWLETGDKQVLLHRALPERTIIFVRLLGSESLNSSAPVAYQIKSVRPMDCNGQYEMRLLPVYPRLKAPSRRVAASYVAEDLMSMREPESLTQLEAEEILQ
jgi:hypothetical protein